MENKNIDENLYNEKSLNLLNIRELRDIGRKLCVPSPTTMKKEELVDYILKVVYGEVKPPRRTACGRPNTREFDMNKYIDKIKKNSDQIEQLQEKRLDNSFCDLAFKVAAPKEDEPFIYDAEQRVVFIDETGCYLRTRQFISSQNDIKVDDKLAKEFNLSNFDVVELIITELGFKIISINGIKLENQIKRFEDEKSDLKAGVSKVFYLRTKEEIQKKIDNIKNNCKKQGLQLISFGLEKYSESFAKTFVINTNDELSEKFKKFITFIEYCKKLIYENKSIVVLFQDMDLVENILNSLEYDVAERTKAHINKQLDDIVRLGNLLVGFKQTKSSNY